MKHVSRLEYRKERKRKGRKVRSEKHEITI